MVEAKKASKSLQQRTLSDFMTGIPFYCLVAIPRNYELWDFFFFFSILNQTDSKEVLLVPQAWCRNSLVKACYFMALVWHIRRHFFTHWNVVNDWLVFRQLALIHKNWSWDCCIWYWFRNIVLESRICKLHKRRLAILFVADYLCEFWY